MSSCVSIGFVFEKNQNIKLLFSKFLEYLIRYGELHKISYSLDKKGKRWKNEVIKDKTLDEIVLLMINNYYGKIDITNLVVDDKSIDYMITITKFSDGDFGFLIEIDIDQLFKVGNRNELEKWTSLIINFCKSIFNIIDYRYAFCDHEVSIEYKWSEFNKLKESIYSISIISKNKGLIIDLSSWEIDGLTFRNL